MKENTEIKKDRFNFEVKDLDFPFYNDNPHLTNTKWIILFIGFVATCLLTLIPKGTFPTGLSQMLYFLIPLLTFLYVANGKIGLICKKFRKQDISLIIIVVILYFAYSIIVGLILQNFGAATRANPALNNLNNIWFWISYPFQLFGEELLKVIPLIISLFLVYKFTGKRKIAIIIAMLISAIIFGLIHYGTYGNIVSVILIQGIGSIPMIYAYVKTKNILVSFIAHLAVDTIIFVGGFISALGASFFFI